MVSLRVSWLISWLAGLLVCWLAGCRSVVWLVGRLVGPSFVLFKVSAGSFFFAGEPFALPKYVRRPKKVVFCH